MTMCLPVLVSLLLSASATAESLTLHRILPDGIGCLELALAKEDQDYVKTFEGTGMQEGTCSDNGYSIDVGESPVKVPFVSSVLTFKTFKRSTWEAVKFQGEAFITSLFGGARQSSPRTAVAPNTEAELEQVASDARAEFVPFKRSEMMMMNAKSDHVRPSVSLANKFNRMPLSGIWMGGKSKRNSHLATQMMSMGDSDSPHLLTEDDEKELNQNLGEEASKLVAQIEKIELQTVGLIVDEEEFDWVVGRKRDALILEDQLKNRAQSGETTSRRKEALYNRLVDALSTVKETEVTAKLASTSLDAADYEIEWVSDSLGSWSIIVGVRERAGERRPLILKVMKGRYRYGDYRTRLAEEVAFQQRAADLGLAPEVVKFGWASNTFFEDEHLRGETRSQMDSKKESCEKMLFILMERRGEPLASWWETATDGDKDRVKKFTYQIYDDLGYNGLNMTDISADNVLIDTTPELRACAIDFDPDRICIDSMVNRGGLEPKDIEAVQASMRVKVDEIFDEFDKVSVLSDTDRALYHLLMDKSTDVLRDLTAVRKLSPDGNKHNLVETIMQDLGKM